MDSLNLHASFQHLSQLDRQQDVLHRQPMDHQARTADAAHQERVEQTEKPQQSDEAQGRMVDPEDRKRTLFASRKRRRKKDRRSPGPPPPSPEGSGLFIDYSA